VHYLRCWRITTLTFGSPQKAPLLDAATADRSGNIELIHFSTEILYEGRHSFNDGDVLAEASDHALQPGLGQRNQRLRLRL